MALIASSSGKTFTPVPACNHIGRCYRVIDLGTQMSEFQGKKRKARKVMIGFELFGEDDEGTPLLLEDGRPMSISKRYTLSLSEKAILRADLESWRGRAFTDDELAGFDLKHLLGVYALVNVKHDTRDGKTYANIASLSPLPKAMRANKPIPVNADQFFDVTEPDRDLYETFSDSLKSTIGACEEWNPTKANEAARRTEPGDGSPGVGGLDDDIPF